MFWNGYVTRLCNEDSLDYLPAVYFIKNKIQMTAFDLVLTLMLTTNKETIK